MGPYRTRALRPGDEPPRAVACPWCGHKAVTRAQKRKLGFVASGRCPSCSHPFRRARWPCIPAAMVLVAALTVWVRLGPIVLAMKRGPSVGEAAVAACRDHGAPHRYDHGSVTCRSAANVTFVVVTESPPDLSSDASLLAMIGIGGAFVTTVSVWRWLAARAPLLRVNLPAEPRRPSRRT
jgi:hypothetical protein